jgi:hypothetical protein
MALPKMNTRRLKALIKDLQTPAVLKKNKIEFDMGTFGTLKDSNGFIPDNPADANVCKTACCIAGIALFKFDKKGWEKCLNNATHPYFSPVTAARKLLGLTAYEAEILFLPNEMPDKIAQNPKEGVKAIEMIIAGKRPWGSERGTKLKGRAPRDWEFLT